MTQKLGALIAGVSSHSQYTHKCQVDMVAHLQFQPSERKDGIP